MGAGGTWDKTALKERPGTYINFESIKQDTVSGGTRGTVILPLANTNYGPAKKIIPIYASAIDGAKAQLGYSVYDDNDSMLLIKEAFKGASTVLVYICTEGKTAATGTGGGLKATAKYKGTRGNALTFVVTANPLGGFDVEVDLDGSKVEAYEGVTAAADLSASEYITFEASGEDGISEVAGVTLTGGADTETANADITAFLDTAGSNKSWNTMAFPFEEEALQAALKTKIKYLRESAGIYVQAVAPNFAADYEGIINVANSYALDSKELTTAQATAYVAGITAGASNVQSNTALTVDGATAVVGEIADENVTAALKAGKFIFTEAEAGVISVESDINSLVTIPQKKDKTYRKNRVIRVLDTFGNSVKANFPPAKYDNDPDGWDVMDGVGASILKLYGPKSDGGVGAIKNIDYSTDFLVDRTISEGDETFFNIGIEPVDSPEKLYFTVSTR